VARRRALIGAESALALLAAVAASALADEPPAPIARPLPPAPASKAPADGGLRAEVERLVGAAVTGDLTVRYRARWTSDETDQDLYQYLNLRVGDETKDAWSGALFLRVAEDLDPRDARGRHVFDSLNDTSGSRVDDQVYSAYATFRPSAGVFETVRLGRQYVYAAETFHVDGVSATTRPLVESIKLRLTAYGGVPVKLYGGGGHHSDWLAGLRAQAEPWTTARAAVDVAHVADRDSVFGGQRNDFAAASLWQQLGQNVDVFGQMGWLDGDGLRDATLRATARVPDEDLVVQASWYRLFETKREFATEFDPYFSVFRDLVRYQQFDLRATKGLGEHFDVEAGGSVRELLHGEHVGPFNRDTRRLFVTPSMTDLPWKGLSVSLTGESWSADGERIKTWAVDVTQKLGRDLKVSVGSDYSLYAFGPLGADERSHVRTAYARVKTALTKSISADLRFTWENDDVETSHVLSLALVFQF
jgi:hypothetical protein